MEPGPFILQANALSIDPTQPRLMFLNYAMNLEISYETCALIVPGTQQWEIFFFAILICLFW